MHRCRRDAIVEKHAPKPGTLLLDTLALCGIVMVVSVALAVPLAAILSHYRRGELSATWVLNTGRAIPTFAIAGLLVPISLRNGWGFEPWPMLIALTMLALPPIYLLCIHN